MARYASCAVSAGNVLIFQSAALGDFILTWPLALALARLHPQSRVIYVTQGEKGRLAERALGVEWTDVEMGWHHLFGDAARLPPQAQHMLARAHTVCLFVSAESDAWTANVHRISPRAQVVCLRAPSSAIAVHAAWQIVGQLSKYSALSQAACQMLQRINAAGLRPASRPANPRTVAIHPGSGSPGKCWPAERFVELARRLLGAGFHLCFLLGEVEKERWTQQQIDAFASVGPVISPPSYLELFQVITGCLGYVGNDSGPSHLAGICGLPTVCIFGPSDPRVWRPLGPRVHVLHRQPIGSIPVEEVANCLIGSALSGARPAISE